MTEDEILGHAVVRSGSPVESLDRYYDLRSAFPDYVRYFEDWRCRSENVRRNLGCSLDVAYGEGDRNRLDIFPAPNADGQVVLFIHGGYWRSMDKSDFSFIAPSLVRRNVSVALINYPLFPGTTMQEVVSQVRSACAWVVSNSRRYGAPCSKLHLVGWSAGAHLATMAAADRRDAQDRCTEVASVLAISGVFDLRPLLRTAANTDLRLNEKTAIDHSPCFLLPRRGQRVALLWGGNETDAFREQSQALLKAWLERGADVSAEEVPGFHHYAIMNTLAEEGSSALLRSLALLRSTSA